MEGKEGKKRKVSIPIIIAILNFILILTSTISAAIPIDVSFTPSNDPPVIILGNEVPSNGSTGIGLTPTCSIDIIDPDGDLMGIKWYENSGGSGWVLRKTTPPGLDGTYTWTFSQASSYSTTYYWRVVVNDSYYTTSAVFHFTTEEEPEVPPPPPGDNEYPVAKITGPSVGYVNQTLVFYANESYDPDGTITGYRWDFDNDGLFDTDWLEGTSITHNYSIAGNYTIRLQVKDNGDATGTDTHVVSILPLEPSLGLPVAEANGPYQGYTNESVNFSSNGSYDPDGNITNYTWYFGDNHTSYLENPTHSYAEPGSYVVTLTVTDNDNLSNSDTSTVYIRNRTVPPPPPGETEFPLLTPIAIGAGVIVSLIVVGLIYKKYHAAKLIKLYETMKKEEGKTKVASTNMQRQGVKPRVVNKNNAPGPKQVVKKNDLGPPRQGINSSVPGVPPRPGMRPPVQGQIRPPVPGQQQFVRKGVPGGPRPVVKPSVPGQGVRPPAPGQGQVVRRAIPGVPPRPGMRPPVPGQQQFVRKGVPGGPRPVVKPSVPGQGQVVRRAAPGVPGQVVKPSAPGQVVRKGVPGVPPGQGVGPSGPKQGIQSKPVNKMKK